MKRYELKCIHIKYSRFVPASISQAILNKEKYEAFYGKKICFLDDVVSTDGTIDAVLKLAEKIGFEIVVIACALTEGGSRDKYKGIPLVSLDNIPLPGKIK